MKRGQRRHGRVDGSALDERPLDAAWESGAATFETDGSTTRAQVRFPAGTDFYGAGLVAAGLLRTGRVVDLWNTDAWRYGPESPALYQTHPYVLALAPDGSATGVLADCARRGQLAIAPDGVEFAFEGGPFEVLTFRGADPAQVQRGLAERVGCPAAAPEWALGYHQSRWGYESADEVLRVARELRAREIPCDAIWLDIDHMDRCRPFSWDPLRFPDPVGLIAELHALGLRVVAILDPGLPADPEHPATAAALDGGHLVLDVDGRPVRGRVWPGVCYFPDFTSAATRAWWAELVAAHVAIGLDGLWVDMNEPSIFRTPTRTLPGDARHAAGSHADVHNLYGMHMAAATREGLLRARPGERPFVLTRSNHITGSRFAATWTGDNQATWEDLRLSIPMVLSLGLCGQPFAGADVGGYDGDPDGELFVRWFELGAYLPFFRGHSERRACRKEPWAFGAVAEKHVRAAIHRRERLRPYLARAFEQAAATGMPVVRPLFFADPRDPELRAVDDAFLLGDDLLVAPVLEPGARVREVQLPDVQGGWSPYPDGGEPSTGRIAVAAPLGTTPVFARAGADLGGCAPR